MRKSILVNENLFERFNKIKGNSHKEKMAELLNVYTQKESNESNVYRIINKMFLETNKVLDTKLDTMSKDLKVLKELKPVIDKIHKYESGY